MNTLQKAERILVDAHKQLLDLTQEIGEGKRIGAEPETVACLLAISKEINKATALLFVSDGTDGATPSIDLH